MKNMFITMLTLIYVMGIYITLKGYNNPNDREEDFYNFAGYVFGYTFGVIFWPASVLLYIVEQLKHNRNR